jgi:hypothetical protein
MKKQATMLILSLMLIFFTRLDYAVVFPVYPLEINSTGNGVLTLNGEHAVEYWVIKTTEYGSLKVSIDAPKGADCTMNAISGDNIAFFNVAYLDETKQSFVMPNLAPGTYKVEVDSRNAQGTYIIRNEFTPASLPHEGSPDKKPGSLSEAMPMSINLPVQGLIGYTTGFNTDGSDSYKIQVPADGRLDIQFTGEETLLVDVYLFDNPTGISIKGNNGAASKRSVIHENIGAGTYYIKVVGSVFKNGNDTYGAYTLSAKLTPNAVPVDVEINDTQKTATPLKSSKMATGHIGYISPVQNDQVDFYTFALTQKGTLRIDLATESKLKGAFGIYRLGNGLEWLGGINSDSKVPYAIVQISKPGTYFVSVSANGYGGYGIKYTFATGSLPKMSPMTLSYADTTKPPITTQPSNAPSSAISAMLGNVWSVNENGYWMGTWTRRGSTDTFDAVWKNNVDSQVIKDVLKVTEIKDNKITIYREGLKGNYYGTLSEDKKKIINGTCTWVTEWWTAEIQK